MRAKIIGTICISIAASLVCATAIADTTYTYDELGRVTSATYENGRQIIYTYDPAGNRTARTVNASVPNPAPTTGNHARTLSGVTTDTFDPRPSPIANFSITAVSPGRYGKATINVDGNGRGISVTYSTAVSSDVVDEIVYTVKRTSSSPEMTASGVITYNIDNGP